MSKKNFLFQNKDTKSENILEFLYKNLYYDKKIEFTKNHLQKMLESGFVRVNDRICKSPSYLLKPKETVSIVILIKDIRRFQKPITPALELQDADILWEDKDLVFINKPEGIPTHATLDPERDHLDAALKRYYKRKTKETPYLALHHRLDHGTSGIIMFCKNKELNKSIADLFSERKIEKTYVAITQNLKPHLSSWEIKNSLARTSSANKDEKQKMQSVASEGDLAHTSFQILESSDEFLAIEAKPHTGRTHQIRVHLYEFGLPILGDKTYHNSESHRFKRMFLHAYRLNFFHPKLKMKISVEAPLPELFKEFFDFDF